MGPLSKKFWRSFYWLKEIGSSRKVEDQILECYTELQREKQEERAKKRAKSMEELKQKKLQGIP